MKQRGWLVMLLLALLGAVIARLLIRPPIEWDLSAGRELARVGWPSGTPREDLWIRGPRSFGLKLPNGKTYRARATNIWVDPEDGLVKRVMAAGVPMTLDEVDARLKQLQIEWGFPLRGFEEWKAGTRRGSLLGYLTVIPSTPISPEYCLEVMPSFNLERPWYVMFKVRWTTPSDGIPRALPSHKD